jgi:phage terminase large subunit
MPTKNPLQTEISLPHEFEPRWYQLDILDALDGGIKKAVCVWHRRAGKDKTSLNYMIKKMYERVGIYYYLFPTYKQGRKILWDGIGKDGFSFLDHFPPQIVDGKPNNTDMKIKTRNGSLFQIVGTDNCDFIVGTNPVGCVFSEYALQNPIAWDYIRPILRENGGWALFVYTPRGKNHGKDLYEMAKYNDDWFAQILTVNDTGIITPEDIQADRDEGMSEELVQQEYFCSFQGYMVGAYYGNQLAKAEEEGRVTDVPWDETQPVDTWWDLGVGDYMSVWFSQQVGSKIQLIDYYEISGEGLPFMAKVIKDQKPYVYGVHHMPHDIVARDISTGKSRESMARNLGISPLYVVPKLSVDDGINAVRSIFSRCWFDKEKCKKGLHSLGHYHKTWDPKRKCFQSNPYHDWSSHASDAFRGMAVGLNYNILDEIENEQPVYRNGRSY